MPKKSLKDCKALTEVNQAILCFKNKHLKVLKLYRGKKGELITFGKNFLKDNRGPPPSPPTPRFLQKLFFFP